LFCFERNKIKTALWQFEETEAGRERSHEAAVPVAQALREERTHGVHVHSANNTQATACFHLSSREAEKDFVQPRCVRLISGHEMPVNK